MFSCGNKVNQSLESEALPNKASSLSSETETGKKKSNSITCIHCKNLITPKHRFSWLIWFILVLFGLLPGLIYWLLRHGKHKCPKCNLSL